MVVVVVLAAVTAVLMESLVAALGCLIRGRTIGLPAAVLVALFLRLRLSLVLIRLVLANAALQLPVPLLGCRMESRNLAKLPKSGQGSRPGFRSRKLLVRLWGSAVAVRSSAGSWRDRFRMVLGLGLGRSPLL